MGSVAPKLIRTEGPRADQRLDVMDTAGMSLDRRRKNGLVGHGPPALGFDTAAEAFGADGAAALYRRAALEDAAVGRRRSSTRTWSCSATASRPTGPPTPTWPGACG